MAKDKAVDSAVLDAGLTAIANAIREKTGGTDALAFPDAMVAAITGFETGGGDTEIVTADDLALFDVVTFGSIAGNPIGWLVADTNYEGHVVLVAWGNIVEGGFNEEHSTDYSRLRLAARWGQSALRQYLNGRGTDWFSENYPGQTAGDYAGMSGFLDSFSDNEISNILPFVSKCVEYDENGNYSVINYSDLVWVPSSKLSGGNAGTAEGSRALSLAGKSSMWLCAEVISRKWGATRTISGSNLQTSLTALTSFNGQGTPTEVGISVRQNWPICISINPLMKLRRTVLMGGLRVLQPIYA